MALSNIFREPRREITESVVGLAIFGVVVWGDYIFARWCQTWDDSSLLFWMFMGALGAMTSVTAAIVVLFATHVLGDFICSVLEDSGIRLRPRRRIGKS